MSIEQDALHKLISQGLVGANVRIDDLRGDGDHYAAHICYEGFRGKSRIQQHQMVYAALKGKMGDELHALQIHTSVPK